MNKRSPPTNGSEPTFTMKRWNGNSAHVVDKAMAGYSAYLADGGRGFGVVAGSLDALGS